MDDSLHKWDCLVVGKADDDRGCDPGRNLERGLVRDLAHALVDDPSPLIQQPRCEGCAGGEALLSGDAFAFEKVFSVKFKYYMVSPWLYSLIIKVLNANSNQRTALFLACFSRSILWRSSSSSSHSFE